MGRWFLLRACLSHLVLSFKGGLPLTGTAILSVHTSHKSTAVCLTPPVMASHTHSWQHSRSRRHQSPWNPARQRQTGAVTESVSGKPTFHILLDCTNWAGQLATDTSDNDLNCSLYWANWKQQLLSHIRWITSIYFPFIPDTLCWRWWFPL